MKKERRESIICKSFKISRPGSFQEPSTIPKGQNSILSPNHNMLLILDFESNDIQGVPKKNRTLIAPSIWSILQMIIHKIFIDMWSRIN